jgi:hypothetical protein
MRGDHNHPTTAVAPTNSKQGDDESAEAMQPDSKKRKLATDERRSILLRECRAPHGKPKIEQVESKECESKQRDSNKATLRMDVNFIQVCRNFLQGHSWKTQRGLEWMYNSCTAIYVYPDCEAIDMVAAIRVEGNGTPFYHPMLVSVKCWMPMLPAQINNAMTNIDTLLRTVRANQDENSKCPRALCLLVLMGAVPDMFDCADLGNFPNEDTFRTISVPTNDPFGISAALNGMTTVVETAEVFTSHGFVYAEMDNAKPSQVLRSRSRLAEVANFVMELFKVRGKEPTDQDDKLCQRAC